MEFQNPTAVASAKPMPQLAKDTTPETPWPVSHASRVFHDAMAKWPALWIDGQISEINTRRVGSAYITLRDNAMEVSIQVMGFGKFAQLARDFNQGDRVVVHGRPDIWQKQTRLSFFSDDIRRVGTGSLRAQIEELRRRLKGEGLFDEANKVPLPAVPRRIGLVCAPQARAEGDVVTNARLRWPAIEFTVVHAHVQGSQCPSDVVAAIRRLDADPDVDVIVVARGGGSFEDLIGFSDESVVRATAACVTPIVSAIGHEDDWTLIDLAADLRASTPTDAAKRVVPDVREQWNIVLQARQRLESRMSARMDAETRLLEGYASRPSLTNPLTMLEQPQRFVDESRARLDIAVRRLVDSCCADVDQFSAALTALSPQSTLDRGYAVVQGPDGHVVDDSALLAAGDAIAVTLKRGRAQATVTRIDAK